MSNVLVISDLQAPFQHPNTLVFLDVVRKMYRCDRIVCIGDEIDFHAISKYTPNPDGYSPGHEFAKAMEFMHQLYKLFPVCDVVTSNHTVRPWKRAFDSGLPSAFIKDYKQALSAPEGWNWHDSITIDNVLYIHGEEYSGRNGTFKAVQDHRMSLIHGHIHSYGGVNYYNNGRERIFGMNVGCLIDVEAYAFQYSRKSAHQATLGCGVCLNGKEAFFIPL